MDPLPPARTPTVVIVGGSLAGLFAGIGLLNLGFSVTILEQSAVLQDAGAGLVLGGDVLEFLRTFDRDKTNLALETKARVYWSREDTIIGREERSQLETSWNALYHALRSNFDGAPGDASSESTGREGAAYKLGCTVTDICVDDDKDEVTVSYTHDGVPESVTSDLVIVADGPSSQFRSKYAKEAPQRKYAGYIGFRGLARESELPAETHPLLNLFSFFHSGVNGGTGNTQFLCYLVPGQDGSLAPGERNLNWVWYENYRKTGVPKDAGKNTVEEEDLAQMLVDNQGVQHEWSVPMGLISERALVAMSRKLSRLPPSMQAVVRVTKNPFIQAITDVSPPLSTLVYSRAHILFVGDAVVGPRPHTASSTNQGALHALSLFHLLSSSLELAALKTPSSDRRQVFTSLQTLLRTRWEKKAAEYAAMLYASGKEMGNRSQFGIHPFSVDKPVEGSPSPRSKSRARLSRTLSGVAL